MPIRVTCPNCDAAANVEEQSLGKRGRCKKCGHVFALARPGGGAASSGSGDASAWKQGSSQPSSPSNLPEQFGRYRIMKMLGQGGMGAVYLARDTKLDREVALKVPYFSPAEGPQAVQRFEREARAAATLDHPNLCQVFDVGEVNGIHYLTMPYIQGKPLSEAIGQDQALTENQAATIVLKLAQALQEAHDKGIIHRDLKPANIMVNRRREMIVMDFGLARVVDADDRPITRTGHVLGTALYMAPEQAAGDLSAIGPACDVYSLGVILYELLTGRRPFEGPWSLVIGLKSVKDPEPPSVYRPNLSPALNAICHKAIAKELKDRYATMNELAEALGVFLESALSPAVAPSSTEAAPPERKPRTPVSEVFRGIMSRMASQISRQKSSLPPSPKVAEASPPGRSLRPWMIGAAGPAAILLLGVIIYVATDKGRIKIEVNDPKATVKVDGKEVLIEGLGEPITLRAGEHDYQVKWGNGEFTTKKFVVKRGENEDLKVEFEPRPIAEVAQPKAEKPAAEKLDQAKEVKPTVAKQENNQASKVKSDLANFRPLAFTQDFADWWKVGQGNWEVSDDGVLTISRDGTNPGAAMLFTKRNNFRNFKLRVEILSPDDYRTGVGIRWSMNEETRIKSLYHLTFGGTRSTSDEESVPAGSIGVLHDVDADARIKNWNVLARKVPAPVGQWQSVEITAIGRRITTSVNGEKVAEFLDDRAGNDVGSILLMRGATWTKFRNMMIQENPAASEPIGLMRNGMGKPSTIMDGQWLIENGELIQSDEDARFPILMFGDPTWTDYDFSVDFMRLRGVADISLLFRCKDHDDTLRYAISAKGDWKYCIIESYEPGGVNRYVGNDIHPIVSEKWYTARVKVRGDHVTVSLIEDDKEVVHIEGDDANHPNGRVGFRTWKSAYKMRNIRVSAPDGKILWEGPPDLNSAGPNDLKG